MNLTRSCINCTQYEEHNFFCRKYSWDMRDPCDMVYFGQERPCCELKHELQIEPDAEDSKIKE